MREPDSAGYVRLAQALVATGQFQLDQTVELVRTPGYPLLLSLGVRLARVELVTIGLQILAACWTTFLVQRIALRFAPPKVALWASLCLAMDPVSLVYACKLLTETSYAALLVTSLYLLIRCQETRSWRSLLLATLSMAASIYVRPIGYFLPAVLAFHMAWLAWADRERRRTRTLQGFAWCVAIVCLLGSWQVRNLLRADYPRFAGIEDVNLLMYQGAAVLVDQSGEPLDRVQLKLRGEQDQIDAAGSDPDATRRLVLRLGRMRRKGRELIGSAPGTVLSSHLAGIWATLTDPGTSAVLSYGGWTLSPEPGDDRPEPGVWSKLRWAVKNKPLPLLVHTLLVGWQWGCLLLATIGVATSVKRHRGLMVLPCLILVYLLFASGGLAGYHRFRVPMAPILCILTGCGLSTVVEWIRGRAAKARLPC